ncbi:putative ribosomal protein SA-like protein [Leptotrombidium deliense]|uniref:Small ribosomal subunit protein uS2 n=1 Tax=Leptotrombidium deliense TaxID=299467 RepID=A0A443RZZ5_9ACAR|nr:putative ribosomal protein SA-like protein [Leptotrombidium deliense]
MEEEIESPEMKNILAMSDKDVCNLLSCSVHIGATNVDFQMKQYVFKRRQDGVHLIDIRKTWQKLLLAARAIVAIEDPADVCAISSRPFGQRAVLKFGKQTGATVIAGRFTPGTFTNQVQKAFKEPRLLIITDPRSDHQAITEASFVNVPVVAFCNTDSPMRYIDIAIPCNNKGTHSIGLMWWMLAREVLRMKGIISRELDWDVMVDLFFFREVEEKEKEEEVEQVSKEFPKSIEPIKVESEDATDNWAPITNDISTNIPSQTFVPNVEVQQTIDGVTTNVPLQKWGVTDWSVQPDVEDNWGGPNAEW